MQLDGFYDFLLLQVKLIERDTEVKSSVISLPLDNKLRLAVKSRSRQDVLRCYQCGKCSASCPVAYTMDIPPHQVMRAVQLGLNEVLTSSTIWLCVFCQTCVARCPCEIDIASVMESLRMMAMDEGYKPAERDIHLFHQQFLNLIRDYGRVPELRLGFNFNIRSGHLLANVGVLPYMLLKKKISLLHTLLLPPKVRGQAEVKRLFKMKANPEETRNL